MVRSENVTDTGVVVTLAARADAVVKGPTHAATASIAKTLLLIWTLLVHVAANRPVTGYNAGRGRTARRARPAEPRDLARPPASRAGRRRRRTEYVDCPLSPAHASMGDGPASRARARDGRHPGPCAG